MEDKLPSKKLKEVEKYSERLLESLGFITKAEREGYYLEAIVRIDALIGLALNYMLQFSCENEEREKEMELIRDCIRKEKFVYHIPNILVKKNLLDKQLMTRIEEWRGFRNKLVHDLFGAWSLLREKGEFDIKNLEGKEKKLLKDECIKGRALLRDLIKDFIEKKTKGGVKFTDLHFGEGT